MLSSEYRCTRHACYQQVSIIGHEDVSARQGHYVRALGPELAHEKMAELFPRDVEAGFSFTVELWKANRFSEQSEEDQQTEIDDWLLSQEK